jgi:hypothetical protein
VNDEKFLAMKKKYEETVKHLEEEISEFSYSHPPLVKFVRISSVKRSKRRCRLSWLTNIAASYMSPNAGNGGGGFGVSANEWYSCAHGAQINLDLILWFHIQQCCGSGSGPIRTFLARSDPDPK